MKSDIVYTHSAQVEQVAEFLSKIDFHNNPLKINIDCELQPIFESDRENFPLIVREALFGLLYEHLKSQPLEDSIDEVEIKKQVWSLVDTYHIILETTKIKKIQNITLEEIPQVCDAVILGKGPREAYVRKAAFVCEGGCLELLNINSDKAIPNIKD